MTYISILNISKFFVQYDEWNFHFMSWLLEHPVLYYNCSKGNEINEKRIQKMTMEEIVNKLNEWIDADHDFSEESINEFCLTYARTYDEYQGLRYTVCGCIEEN